ncbi:MAG: hypothetical protein LBI85_02595, partial [Spirochaetaceae bacterium]|nr:hypothetical protein [Spirochaetaceae bacterium]
MLVHALLTKNDIKNKILLSMIYVAVMIFQLTHNALITFAENAPPFISLRSRIVAIVLAAIPFIIYGMTLGNKNIKRYLPSIQDLTVFTFNELTENINSVK